MATALEADRLIAESPVPARIWLTTGDPAGIGPDLTLRMPELEIPAALTAVGDPDLLRRRARQLGLDIEIRECGRDGAPETSRPGRLWVLPVPLSAPEVAGQLDPRNGKYVLTTLTTAANACNQDIADAMVTAPVNKAVIVEAGYAFTGHTEFLAELLNAPLPVMLLVAGTLRVALATTHLALRDVPDAITKPRLAAVIRILHAGLRERFNIKDPRIAVCGLNPHAGEKGVLGREEIEIIAPVLEQLRNAGLQLEGPVSADTAFTPQRLAETDAVVAMYHDQGLPVLKHAGFGSGINVTLGLPIIRTSVDHGTALELAGTGRADPGSLKAALSLAIELVGHRRVTAHP